MKIPEIQATVAAEQTRASSAQVERARPSRVRNGTLGAAAEVMKNLEAAAQSPRPESASETRRGEQVETGAVNPDQVRELAQSIETNLEERGVSLKFRVLDEEDTVQVEVVDPATEKVVRKIPSDELIKLAANIREQAGGLLNRMF